MIPRQRLSTKGIQPLLAERIRPSPAAELKSPVATFKACCGNRARPSLIGAIEGLEPGIHPCPRTPCRFDDRRQAPIPTTDEVLHGREPHIREVEADTTEALPGLPKQLLTP